MINKQLVIIGAGAAGLAAALGASENGIKDILIIEKEKEYGGILGQCIHNGFGLHTFNEELSGPSYGEKYFELLKDKNIEFLFESYATSIVDKVVTIISPLGIKEIKAEAIIIASGSKERAAGAIGLKGDRVAGIYTAGTAQKYLNKEGYMVGKKVFILGSGDIGLIMARRMTLEGAKVIGVAEIMPYSNGLARNIKQCLEDFDIPLYLSTTVESVHGKGRVESITLVKVDEKLNKIENTEKIVECDCLLLSVGLMPEISLIENNVNLDPKTKSAVVSDDYMTSNDGIFIAGNALHIHDLVDYVSNEGYRAGVSASKYILNKSSSSSLIKVKATNGISYVVPQYFDKNNDQEFMFRVNKVFKESKIHIHSDNYDKYINKLGILPSEMQKVIIKKEDLKDINDELTFEVLS